MPFSCEAPQALTLSACCENAVSFTLFYPSVERFHLPEKKDTMPTVQDAFHMLDVGNNCFIQNQLEDAERCYRQAIEWHPNYPQALTNLGSVLQEKGLLNEAIEYHKRAIRVDPHWVDAYYNLGNACREIGDHQLAIDSFEQALRLRPDFAQAHLNLGLTLLLVGRYREGLAHYEWRFACGQPALRPFTEPRWDGGEYPGKRLLIYTEQGFGDILMFARFIAKAAERSRMRVIFECPATIHPILSSVSGVDEWIEQGAILPSFDMQISLLSLPFACQTELDSIPSSDRYLKASSSLSAYWQSKLAPCTGFRIGIAWQGDPTYRWDSLRSLPLRMFLPLAQVDGVRLISLQKGFGSEQIEETRPLFDIYDCGDQLDRAHGAFMDTAAIMDHLDLVISPDTAVIHLAGALGVPAWLVLPTIPHWPWLLHGSETVWYPQVRIFRQEPTPDREQTTTGAPSVPEMASLGLSPWLGVFESMERKLRSMVLNRF
jgi:Tetratricopeptide repeat